MFASRRQTGDLEIPGYRSCSRHSIKRAAGLLTIHRLMCACFHPQLACRVSHWKSSAMILSISHAAGHLCIPDLKRRSAKRILITRDCVVHENLCACMGSRICVTLHYSPVKLELRILSCSPELELVDVVHVNMPHKHNVSRGPRCSKLT
jgi:hypothetical protein